MDNLQREYLVRLSAAKQKALSGKFHDCLEACLELRLLPDLSPHTRALVCLTICDVSIVEELPDKTSFAEEALKIARELQAQSNTVDSFWIDQYAQLEEDAISCLHKAENETQTYARMINDEREYAEMVNDSSDTENLAQQRELADEMGALTVAQPEFHSPENASIDDLQQRKLDEDENTDGETFLDSSTGRTWHSVPDSGDEDVDEDMPQV